MISTYWITNVLLEDGYIKENDTVIATETNSYHVHVENSIINKIIPAIAPLNTEEKKYNAKEKLMLPSFKEKHIHLDKTYYGGPWKAVERINSIFDRFKEEEELLPKQLPTATERAEKILRLLISNGTSHVRTHCNIDPVIELKNLEKTNEALTNYTKYLTHEVVAFPQHGLLRSDVKHLVKDAMRNGATLVGGVDPYTVDGDINKSLETIMDIAVEFDAGVDIHIHDRGEKGLETMQKLASLTEKANWNGKVTVSHGFGLATIPKTSSEELAEQFADLNIGLTSTVPIGNLIMPIPMLKKKGVKVELGTDSLTDHWSPFGTGDNLEKANRLAELYGYVDEYSLSQALGFITGGITPLSDEGKRVWPKIGDIASAVFVNASSSAEAVARKPKREIVLFNGRITSGSF